MTHAPYGLIVSGSHDEPASNTAASLINSSTKFWATRGDDDSLMLIHAVFDSESL